MKIGNLDVDIIICFTLVFHQMRIKVKIENDIINAQESIF